jgi:SurA N-terminal domain
MRIMGRPRALVAVLAACLLLAGCGSGPSQVRAAAFLGDQEISIDQVQALIDKAVQEQPAAQQLAQQHKLDQLGREAVRQLVLHQLITQTAQQDGVSADPAQVSQLLAQDPLAAPVPTANVDPSQLPQQIVYRARDHREVISDQLLLQSLGAQYFDKVAVTFDYTTVASDSGGAQPVTMREKAFAKAGQMAADPQAAGRIIQADAAAGVDAATGVVATAVKQPDLAGTVLFGAKPGTVVAFQPSSEDATWAVVVVRKRDLATPQAADQSAQPTSSQLATLGQRLLQPRFDQADLKINPRYGVWDPTALNLAPSAAETTGLILSVKGSAQP